jgi:uncharacterized SAM-binding protein YcdF (DUF218 family)
MKRFLTALILVAVAYGLAFFLWVSLLPPITDVKPDADGIVVLTGGGPRLDTAMALFEGGVGKRLLISGVSPTTTRDTVKDVAHGGARFDCCADIGYAAEDTYGNAEEAADWVALHHYKSLIIVTASYHMPRSLRFFHSLMPGVRLVPYPVEPEGVNMSAWWRPGTLHLLHNEYLKYVASFVMTAVDHRSDDNKSAPTS